MKYFYRTEGILPELLIDTDFFGYRPAPAAY